VHWRRPLSGRILRSRWRLPVVSAGHQTTYWVTSVQPDVRFGVGYLAEAGAGRVRAAGQGPGLSAPSGDTRGQKIAAACGWLAAEG